MPKGSAYNLDEGMVKDHMGLKRQNPSQPSGGGTASSEFGINGKATEVDGVPFDSSARAAHVKPKDYEEVGSKAKKFC